MGEPFKSMKKLVGWAAWLLVFFISSSSYAGGRLVFDEVGRGVLIPDNPRRIVSLAPSITETLFALGLDDEIVGVTGYCDYPTAALERPKVGGFVSPSIEKILSLGPDLVMATSDGNRREVVDRLTELGIAVFVTYPKNLDEIFLTIETIGWITGRKKEATRILRDMKRRRGEIIRLTKDLEKPKVFFQVGHKLLMTVGRDTFANDLIRTAGGLSISRHEPTRYPVYSIEGLLIKQPDIIIITSMDFKKDCKGLVRTWARWDSIPAVENGKVFVIDSELVDRPSPRIIEGLEELAEIIHPQAFKRSN